MAYCKNCGTQLPDGANVCPSCGAAYTPPVNEPPKKAEELLNTPDETGSFNTADIEENKGLCVLSYIYILFILPLILKPGSPFVKFHVNQGLVLFIVNVIASVITAIPIIGWIVGPIVGLVTFVLMILGIINAASGKAKELPIIGKFRIIK